VLAISGIRRQGEHATHHRRNVRRTGRDEAPRRQNRRMGTPERRIRGNLPRDRSARPATAPARGAFAIQRRPPRRRRAPAVLSPSTESPSHRAAPPHAGPVRQLSPPVSDFRGVAKTPCGRWCCVLEKHLVVHIHDATVQGERPALLSCQDAHFSKNSQEGAKSGRNLMKPPSCLLAFL
jgi:hypothetical protein